MLNSTFNESSANEVFRVIELFGQVSGLSLNKSKCEGMRLGTMEQREKNLFGISWPKRPISALGAHFSSEQEQNENLNFHEKLVKLEKSLKMWSVRGLTPIGKICVLKMIGISKLIYTCSNLHVPQSFPKMVNSLIRNFVWNYLPPKIKGTTMVQSI